MIRAASSTAPSLPATNSHTSAGPAWQVPAAEHIERQIAVFVVVCVIEAALLHAVQRDVGIVEIEHDLARRPLMRLKEEIDQQRIDLYWSQSIFLYFSLCRSGVCSTRLSVLLPAKASQFERSTGGQLPGQRLEYWILAQLVVVVEVLIAQHQTEDPLPNYCLDLMLDIASVAPVAGSTWQTDGSARGRDQPGQAAVHLRST